jgi:Origin of replication binding protein
MTLDITPGDALEYDDVAAMVSLANSTIVATTTVTTILRAIPEHPPVWVDGERVWGHFAEWTPRKELLPGVTDFVFSRDKDQKITFVPGMIVSAKKEYIELESFEQKVRFMDTNDGNHTYEVIPTVNQPTYTFFDVDRKDIVYTWKEVSKALIRAVQGFLDDTGIGGGLKIRLGDNAQLSESSTPIRTSIHLVVRLVMRNAAEHHRFTHVLSAWIETRSDAFPELVKGTDCVLDKDLHNNWRNFRFPYQSKKYAQYSVPFRPRLGSSAIASEHAVVKHAQSPAGVPADVFKHMGQVAALQPRTIPAVHKAAPSVRQASRPIAMNELLQKHTDLFNAKQPLVDLLHGPVRVKYITHLEGGVNCFTLDDARCPYAGRKHKSNHIFITSHPRAEKKATNMDAHKDLHVHCHDPDCRATYSVPYIIRHHDTLDVMHHDEMNVRSMHPQASNIQWDEDYDEVDMRPLPVRPLVCVRAGMGVGKTKAMHAVVRQNCGDTTKAMIVTFSKSLALKLRADFKDLGFECYSDRKGDLFGSRIVVCLDSLWRVNTRNFDFVFVDEAVSVFLHFNSPLMSRSSENSALLELLITQSSANVYLVDACIDQTFTKQLADYFGDAKTVQPYWIRNRFVRPSNRVATIKVSHCVGNALAENDLSIAAISKVMALLSAGKRVVVCSSTKRFAVALEQYVLKTRANTRMLVYHSGATESLDDVNDLWRSCDLLVYSPSISAGVSFERKHFDSMVAFLVNSNYTPSVDISLQQLFRVRNLGDGDMNIFVQDSVCRSDDFPCTESSVEKLLNDDISLVNKFYLSSQLSSLAQHKIVGDALRYDPDRMSYRVIKGIILMRHRSLMHYVDLLSGSLREDYGMTVSIEDLPLDASHDLDIATLATCGKMTAFPPFDDLEILALSADGRRRYGLMGHANASLSDVERAEKLLHELAVNMWKVDAIKIDKAFYDDFVATKDAFETFYRAKRFVLMSTQNAVSHRQQLRDKMDAIIGGEDPNIVVYKTKLKQFYTKLISGHALIAAIMTPQQRATLRQLDPVTLEAPSIELAYTAFRDSLESDEKKAMLKLFELTETTGSFIAARKIVHMAFGIDMQRKSKRCTLAAYKVVEVNVEDLRRTRELYQPALLDPLVI